MAFRSSKTNHRNSRSVDDRTQLSHGQTQVSDKTSLIPNLLENGSQIPPSHLELLERLFLRINLEAGDKKPLSSLRSNEKR